MSPFEAWVTGVPSPTTFPEVKSLVAGNALSNQELSARTGAVRTACLRLASLQTCPLQCLRAVMEALKGQSVCVLAHEEEYGTTALYVNSSRPLCDILNPELLQMVDIQPQGASVFTLKRPYNRRMVQEAMNFQAATHVGFNAAVVHSNSDLLTLFEDPGAAPNRQTSPQYTVNIVFRGDMCPVSEPGSTAGVVKVQSARYGAQDYRAIQGALLARPEVTTNRVIVKCGPAGVTVEPRQHTELLVVKDIVLEALHDMGLPYHLTRNHMVLIEEESDVTLHGCSAEINIAPALASDPHTELTSSAVVCKILPELGSAAHLRVGPTVCAFDLAGSKCRQCMQIILQRLTQSADTSKEYVKIGVNLSRNVLLVTHYNDQNASCVRHVTSVLHSLQIPATVLSAGPAEHDVVDAEVMQYECQLYAQALKPHHAVGPPGGQTNVLEIALRPDSVSCLTCANLLEKSISNMLLPLRNVVVDSSQSILMLEHATEQVAESEILSTLDRLGYQPQVVEQGKQLLSSLHNLLHARSTIPASSTAVATVPHVETEDLSDVLGVDQMSSLGCVAAYPAKVYFQPGQQSTSIIFMLTRQPSAASQLAADEDHCYDLQFLKSPAEPAVPCDMASAPLFLEKEYTIWYDKVVDRSKPNAPDCNLVELESFNTVQDFWRVWKKFDLYRLQEGDVIMVFRKNVQPNIHHPVNKGGGKWYTRALPLETRAKLWTGLVLAMLGENLEDNTNNEVVGVVLSVKPGGDRIEVWVDGDYHHHAKHGHDSVPLHRQLSPTMGDILARVLSLNPGRHRLHYWTHVAYERHRKLHSGSARRDKRKHKMAVACQVSRTPSIAMGA